MVLQGLLKGYISDYWGRVPSIHATVRRVHRHPDSMSVGSLSCHAVSHVEPLVFPKGNQTLDHLLTELIRGGVSPCCRLSNVNMVHAVSLPVITPCTSFLWTTCPFICVPATCTRCYLRSPSISACHRFSTNSFSSLNKEFRKTALCC